MPSHHPRLPSPWLIPALAVVALAATLFPAFAPPAGALPGPGGLATPPPGLPEPSPDNTFYVFAIWDPIMRATEPQVAA